MELAKLVSLSDYCNTILEILHDGPVSLTKLVFMAYFFKDKRLESSKKTKSQKGCFYFFEICGSTILDNGNSVRLIFASLDLLEKSGFVTIGEKGVSIAKPIPSGLIFDDLPKSFYVSLKDQLSKMTEGTFLSGVAEYVPY